MNNPKADNQLNLALDATAAEREKSMDLNVGYDPADRQWDLIVNIPEALTRCSLMWRR